ncbi:MAG: hypothetical protein JEZ06_06750 [Anaerolineaceae bacterium]|nr:hypothetical protein [Anaerolineaceae bacterium]
MLKIYQADTNMRLEQIDAIKAAIPGDWQFTDAVEGASVILTESVDITAKLLSEAGKNLRLILCMLPGTAKVSDTTVPVEYMYDAGLIGVAEHTVTLILTLSRHFLQVARQTRLKEWAPGKDEPIFTDQRKYTYNWIDLPHNDAIYRKKVGIIGLGFIGREVVKRLRAFNVQIFYTDLNRFDPAVEKELGVEWRELDDLLKECDFISLHLRFVDGPDGNDKMFSTREFELMKSSAYFINTARGRLVDEDALVKALQDGMIAGAGMDVFRYEPLHKDSALLNMAGDNVILSAHVSGTYMPEAWATTAQEVVERVQAVIN